ncbi:HAD family phosphatase [Paenibacillus sp. GSMTC-2017]|uniref:HAD-IIB family hydrolase n=1 Tax=Paenibacillus sp. GSMTC-2017 TaxID=2794350 RepID=UPI0018D5F923|nr:HAD-IIB family hydrolase [Paenibacillus sp. GSMTC-2017]MBH5316252.1 HAD family phosphatase [Paenibacillus sp. GSMTC-2017]
MKIVFDLDGTICFKGKPLSESMVQALDKLVSGGHEIIFASARPIRDMLPILPVHMHRFSMVGGNGGFVAKDGSIISTVHFDSMVADTIIKLLEQYEADYLIDSSWDYSFSGSDDHPIRRNIDPDERAKNIPLSELNEIVKAVILHTRYEQQMLVELHKLPIIIYIHGHEGIIDISPEGVDKWVGLQKLGVKPQQFIAFGNDTNDLSMFKHAKRSICVGDHTNLLQLATDKVSIVEEDVVQKIVELLVVTKVN